LDCPSSEVVFLVFFLIIASGFDAYLTLINLQAVAVEANPVMDLAFRHGTAFFVAVKMALTAVGVYLLSVHQAFRMGRAGLRLLSISYVFLLVYHSLLLLLVQ